MIKWIILAIFILSALYIQQRGKVRHSFSLRYHMGLLNQTMTAALLMWMVSAIHGAMVKV